MADPPSSTGPRLLGSSSAPLQLGGTDSRTIVHLDNTNYQWLAAGLAADSGLEGKLFLKLDHILGVEEAAVLKVYLAFAAGPTGTQNRQLVGSRSLYGLSVASITAAGKSGTGLGFSFDVTALFVEHPLLLSPELGVVVETRPTLPLKADLQVERISLYYQPNAS